MTAYYNEIDPYAAQWLRNLIAAGHIAPGVVDERSIEDVRPEDLRGFAQCHFFAGIGVWSYALRKAGWPDDRPIWTGSCPCQPFSTAGKGDGFADERHLWPAFHWLIEQCRPTAIVGEQVASKDALAWIDLVQTDLEGTGYAFGAVDTCAAGFGAPHIRQRLYWFAESEQGARQRREPSVIRLVHPGIERLEGYGGNVHYGHEPGRVGAYSPGSTAETSSISGMADSELHGGSAQIETASYGKSKTNGPADRSGGRGVSLGGLADDDRPGPTNGCWRTADWLFCRDGKWRPVESGASPLANGAPSRLGRLRAYGNAINAAQAQGFIEAYLDTEQDVLTDLLEGLN